MSPHRPEIFVSATSQDLRTCRQLIKEALLTLGCVPIEQTNFPPDARTVREMLRVKITACDAVVHVAGEVYGAEPSARDPGEPRRSYTQLEYELATELGKPVYVFVCGAGFPYDEHPPEDTERQTLQQQHRTRLQKSDHIYTPVGSRDELALRVHALQTRVEALSGELNKTRSWLGRGIAIGIVALTLLGGGLWWLNHRVGKTESKVTKLETELDKQRRYLKSVADAFTAQQAQLRQLKLTDDEIFNRAVANVAAKEKVPETELRSGIDLFVVAIRADAKADFYDRALAEFAQKNFAAAAQSAGAAGNAARDQYLSADKLVAQVAAQGDEARTHAREAFSLQGQSLYAERKFGEAVTALEAALEAAPRAKVPPSWAELQVILGMMLNDWAAVVTGSAIAEHRVKAVAAYRAALEVYTREARPLDWARTQNNLAIALGDQAAASAGPAGVRFLAEAVAAYRAALEVFTRETLPLDWATTQVNLASALSIQAAASAGPESIRLLAEAVAAYRAALEVFTRTAAPQDWARTQNNLASALSRQAAASAGPDGVRLLDQAAAAYRAALEVYNREALPQEWAATQNNLAGALCDQAASSAGPEGARLLAEAVAAYRAALEVFTRNAAPQDWAMTQNNLAAALRDQAAASAGPEGARLLAEAVAAYRAALEVRTRKALPQDWATTQSNLAVALCNQAAASAGPESAQLLAEAVAAYRATLEVYTREALPQDWARTQNNLAGALCNQAAASDGPDSARLLAEAVAAYRAALEVRTREALPQEWARTQSNLANALCNQAAASDGPDSARLLAEAIAAKRAALEILTADVDPEWHRQQLEWIAEAEAVLKKL